MLLLMLALGLGQTHSAHGTVDFKNSCSSAVQPMLQQAVATLHSFGPEAEQTFRAVLREDPSCAIATWGIASILMTNPLAGVGPSPILAARAQAAIAEGRRIGAKTERERAYIEAVAAYYEDFATRPDRTRQAARARAFETLAANYPDDDEAQIFAALYLAATQSLSDQSYKTYLKAAEVLERQAAKHPDHPGVIHYLIHVYDAPPLAQQGLPAARRYADVAPAEAHALHMPSHIFTRVGAWKESAATNERSAQTAKRNGDGSEQLHAMDYMTYAYLQMARDDDARRIVDESTGVTTFAPTFLAGPYARAAIPARYAIERGDWRRAASLEPETSNFPFVAALTHLARAIGAARLGDAAAASKDVEALARLRDQLKPTNEYWSNEVEVSRLGAAAWTAWASERHDEALALMRAAADAEDKSEKHIVTPGRLLPAREMLGEMLLAAKRPADALEQFETSQRREPDRFRGLYGAATAAAQSGDRVKAKRYYARLIEIAGDGSTRPELQEARRFQ
jgi:tetratricopeptide (TPR) repeat protein